MAAVPTQTPVRTPDETATGAPTRVLSHAVAGAFHVASKLRGERVLHPRGRTVAGRLTVPGTAATGAELLDRPGIYEAQVRLSRAVGLPAPLPDGFGLAIRVLDAYGLGRHQDLLMTSTFAPPLLRRLPVPFFHASFYGSLLPYDVGDGQLLFGARQDGSRLRLLHATADGPWQPWGELQLGEPLPGGRQIPVNVWTTGGGLVPAGLLMRLRREAYPASRSAVDA
jgi:hypothetical protein